MHTKYTGFVIQLFYAIICIFNAYHIIALFSEESLSKDRISPSQSLICDSVLHNFSRSDKLTKVDVINLFRGNCENCERCCFQVQIISCYSTDRCRESIILLLVVRLLDEPCFVRCLIGLITSPFISQCKYIRFTSVYQSVRLSIRLFVSSFFRLSYI